MHAAGGRAVLHRRPSIAIWDQPGPSGLLELVEHHAGVRDGGARWSRAMVAIPLIYGRVGWFLAEGHA